MQKRLYRSRSERMMAGVCGGLAEYFNIDPTIVRVVFIALSLLGGPGLILYIILAIVVPEQPYDIDSKLKNDWDNDNL